MLLIQQARKDFQIIQFRFCGNRRRYVGHDFLVVLTTNFRHGDGRDGTAWRNIILLHRIRSVSIWHLHVPEFNAYLIHSVLPIIG